GVDDESVGFLGDAGYGKSSLAAAFLAIGCRLVTDDLLVLEERVDGFYAHPGPPRIKLTPTVLVNTLGGEGVSPDGVEQKQLVALDDEHWSGRPARLRALYAFRS